MKNIKFYTDSRARREVVAINYTKKTMLFVHDNNTGCAISHISCEMFDIHMNTMQFGHLDQTTETWFQTVRIAALVKLSNDVYSPVKVNLL